MSAFEEGKELGLQVRHLTERFLLIHVATQIHAAAIASPAAPGEIFTSVNEAAELIQECDKWLAEKREQPEPTPV